MTASTGSSGATAATAGSSAADVLHAERASAELPKWYPSWVRALAEQYLSGTASVFVLHGNVYDVVPLVDPDDDGAADYGTVTDFLAEQLFGRWALVLHYDLGRGLRSFAGRSEKRLKEMVALATRRIGDLSTVKNDPAIVIGLLDLLVRENVMAAPEKRLKIAILINQASFLFPAGEPGRTNFAAAGMLVTLLNWATSTHVKHLEMACVLIDERRSDVSDRVTGNPHVATVEVPLPSEAERLAFLRDVASRGTNGSGSGDWSRMSDYTVEQLATLSAGMSLNDLGTLVRAATRGGPRLDSRVFRDLKKRLLERQGQGLLEFIEPKWKLDTVIGHEAAKQRLRDDAALLARGALDCVPMGYLLCGPVGTGKSFLAM